MKTCPVCAAEWPDETKFCPNDGSTLRSATGASLIGSVIADRYHIEKKLGEGGMGAVYLGEHVKMGRKSAIKVMAQSMASDPEAIARFNREAANAARINHPNVCAIYDFGETREGIIYLAMEFIEGDSLNTLLKSQTALAPRRAAAILKQAADALQAAHDLGIVHRDLKPDNIMLARGRAGSEVVKVVDFGIAKAMGGEEGQKVTKTGLVVGTPEYMSPEQLSGDVLDGRSDIYSLGLVFFRMLTGRLPFEADSAQETMIKRLTDEPMRLSEALPGVEFPARLQEVMDKVLQRMPSHRYASASQFAHDVESAIAGMAESAPAVDTEGATQLISAQGATAPLAKTEVAGASPRGPRTPTTPAPAPTVQAPTAGKRPVALIAASLVAVAAVGGTAAVMWKGKSAEPPIVEETAGGAAPVMGSTDSARPGSQTGGSERTQTPTRPAGDRGGETRATGPAGTPPVGGAGEETSRVAPPTPDTIAIRQDIVRWGRDLANPGQRASAEAGLQDIFRNVQLPAYMRAQAAAALAEAYEETDTQQACRWYDEAIRLNPTYPVYQTLRNTLSCTP
jgi:serine/threonine-protein kinase